MGILGRMKQRQIECFEEDMQFLRDYERNETFSLEMRAWELLAFSPESEGGFSPGEALSSLIQITNRHTEQTNADETI